jgi:hypothetical protein
MMTSIRCCPIDSSTTTANVPAQVSSPIIGVRHGLEAEQARQEGQRTGGKVQRPSGRAGVLSVERVMVYIVPSGQISRSLTAR